MKLKIKIHFDIDADKFIKLIITSHWQFTNSTGLIIY